MTYFYTWQAQRGARGLDLRGGHGVWMETDAGEVLDLGALVYQANAGHGHRRIVDAIKAQADRLCLAAPSSDYPEKRALAQALLEKAPDGFSTVFFCLGGSDANENALKIARLHTGRYKAVARYRSYHGATLGAVSLTGDWRRVPVEPALPGVVHVMDLEDDRPTDIPRTLELEGEVGAVFLESVPGANGVVIPRVQDMRAIREACTKHGALLVMDEVLVGFGRTGKYFAFEHFGVTPDLITCGKAITAGYGVLGAVLVHERVARSFDDRILACGLTHYAHPLGVAAALEAMRVYDDEKLVENAETLGPRLAAGLSALPEPVVGTRSLGLLGAADLALDAASLKMLDAALRREKVFVHVKSHGQTRRDTAMLVVSPPLCISADELDEGLARIARALASLSR